MKKQLPRLNLSSVARVTLCSLSVLLLVSCALPYTPGEFSSPAQAITDVLNNPALRIPILLAGLALLLAGLWLAELIIALPGFVIGAVIGAGIGTAANNGHFGILSILLAVVVGAVGAWLALALFILGVFFSGFAIGFVIGGSIGTTLFHSKDAVTTIGVILGVLAGVVSVALWKFLQIVISSGVGAALIGVSLGITDKPLLLVLIWVVGIAIQSGFLRVFGPPKRTIRAGRRAIPPRPPSSQFPPPGQG